METIKLPKGIGLLTDRRIFTIDGSLCYDGKGVNTVVRHPMVDDNVVTICVITDDKPKITGPITVEFVDSNNDHFFVDVMAFKSNDPSIIDALITSVDHPVEGARKPITRTKSGFIVLTRTSEWYRRMRNSKRLSHYERNKYLSGKKVHSFERLASIYSKDVDDENHVGSSIAAALAAYYDNVEIVRNPYASQVNFNSYSASGAVIAIRKWVDDMADQIGSKDSKQVKEALWEAIRRSLMRKDLLYEDDFYDDEEG